MKKKILWKARKHTKLYVSCLVLQNKTIVFWMICLLLVVCLCIFCLGFLDEFLDKFEFIIRACLDWWIGLQILLFWHECLDQQSVTYKTTNCQLSKHIKKEG
ncbi:hypothetical protein AX774_g7835 [Zancudomyces culisetae]|uniref:Uncharacterized protein n=1 Tax=Zancudomyces culisetae TaxID=1213189 RepID=A0A1R1PCV9_ZANCU|nr:hypothetical protein AX774_g7835 [Zancudomyces culisetae]|eukprot:OMH78771.1 hypothetical protein AX774_g7835 [Zancudomyces culisetae]